MAATESVREEQQALTDRRRFSAPRWILLGLFLLALGYGLIVGNDYGSSTDEPANAQVGKDALKAYRDRRGFADYLEHDIVLAHHGPSYFMVYSVASEFFERLIPRWHEVDGRHFTNYLTHLLAAGCFYYLARRLMGWPYAALATVFFASQPMLLGHAFINQKDTPFMAFFLASLVAGLVATDRLATANHERIGNSDEGTFSAALKSDWSENSPGARAFSSVVIILTLIAVLDVLFFEFALQGAKDVLSLAYQGQAWEPINRLFLAVAEDAQSATLDDYLFRLRWLYWRSRLLLAGLALLPALIKAFKLFPRTIRFLRRRFRGPGWWVLLAGSLMGFTISIRPVGGFAGLLVSLYWLRKLRARSFGLLLLYWTVSGVVMYATWPYLWPDPLQRSVASIAYTGGFDKATRYMGEIVYSKSLPWHYFPVLATLEHTEPTIPLVLLGTGITFWRWWRERWASNLLAILFLWFAIPLIGLLVFKLSVYGNLRHLLFVLVPMFLMAGVGIRAVLKWLPKRWLQVAVYCLLVLPSVIGIVIIHPYEYGYFNIFSGGIEQASHDYLLDRWCTSYREAMQYVNENAYPNAIISPTYTDEVAAPFARGDLKISTRDVDALNNAAYHLTCAFFVGGRGYKRTDDWHRVHTVGRAGAVFAEVYRKLSVPPWYP